MSKKRMKTRLGADGIDYPYTSESLVFDNKGRSIDQKYATKEDLESLSIVDELEERVSANEESIAWLLENGGGGGGTISCYISTTDAENFIISTGNDLTLHLDFFSPNVGKGTLKVFINDVESKSVTIAQGDTATIIEGDLFNTGSNTMRVYVVDRTGNLTNELTFYVRYGSTQITSTFDPYISYDFGSIIRYYFTVTALDTSDTLTFYIKIDDELQNPISCKSEVRAYFTFPSTLSVGSHYCEAWAEDSVGKSNILKFNIVILDDRAIVVASDTQTLSVEEGSQVSLDYKVYMKNNTTFITKVYIDNEYSSSGTCGLETSFYKTSNLKEGIHTIKLEVWDTTETVSDYVTWTVTITPSTYEMVTATTAGASAIFTAMNRLNSDENRETWIGTNQDGEEIIANLSNFAFNSESGWVDDNLIISGNSAVEIPITPLANNAKYGFTLDIEFTSKAIGVQDALVLKLWDDTNNCGIKITTEELILRSKDNNECRLYFTDNENTSVMFIIDRDEGFAKIYLNGVMCEAFHLNDYTVNGVAYLEDFTVNDTIKLGGSGYCQIKNLRVYEIALATNEILNNFISNETNKEAQRMLVEFQKGDNLPTLTIYGDFSGLGKDDKKPCDIVYLSTDVTKYGESFTLSGKTSTLQYQGTSSMAYPIKNYRINLRDSLGNKWKYNPFNGGQPESRFCLKADFITSNHAHNTGMAKFISDKLYNYDTTNESTMNPAKWWSINNGGKLTDTRETINGFPCRLILVNDGDTALNEGQAEPTPGNTKDMGIFNFNNDKDNVSSLGLDNEIFPNAMSYEVTANSDTSAGAFVPFTKTAYVDVIADLTQYGMTTGVIPFSEFGLKGGETLEVCELWSNTDSNSWIQFIDSNSQWICTEYFTTDIRQVPIPNAHYMKISFGLGTNYTEEVAFKINNTIIKPRIDDVNEGGTTLIIDEQAELEYLQNSFELRYPDEDDVGKDYGYLGMEIEALKTDYYVAGGGTIYWSNQIEHDYFGSDELVVSDNVIDVIGYNSVGAISVIQKVNGKVNIQTSSDYPYIGIRWKEPLTSCTVNGITLYAGEEVSTDVIKKNPYVDKGFSTDYGLKRVIDWVGNCTDEEFVADFDKYFNRHYTLRYYLLVVLMAGVDNLGKNMMLDTWDGQIWYPRFYDIDTILSYDNSGEIKFDVDIEMEQGYWNTSASRLWTKVRDNLHDELVEVYKQMRGNGVTYEQIMHYMYDEQIGKIPQTYYNKDFDIKYAPYSDQYIGKAHGDGYEHMKRWLKRRFIFCDTLFDYAPSYENDVLTIRANTLEEMHLTIDTYTPLYQHVSFYNGNMEKIKITPGQPVTFSGTAQTATDQEVLIYGGSNIKKITGIQSMNPNSMLIGFATRLTELDISNCPILTIVNSNKANFSPHTYLNKLNISNCPQLGGNLNVSNSPLLQEINARGSAITGLLLPTSLRNLKTLELPNTISSLALYDASSLETVKFDEGVVMQSIELSNCAGITNTENFDLTKTPTVILDNSYNTEELYMSETTNLTLRNMSNLERVIYTPNSEYSDFDINNVINGKNYKVTTSNCPKLSTFMTTAPHRLSYNGEDVEYIEEIIEIGTIELLDGTYVMGGYWADNGNYTSANNMPQYTAIIPSNIDIISVHIKTSGIASGQHVRVTFFKDDTFLSRLLISYSGNEIDQEVNIPTNCNKIIFVCDSTYMSSCTCTALVEDGEEVIIIHKDYGDITPNTVFTANTLDLADTQFQNVKFLCTTDVYNLKVPTTMKNFYCDSAFDIDTDVIEEASYEIIHEELIEEYTTNYNRDVYRLDKIYTNFPNKTQYKGIALSPVWGVDEYGFAITTTGWNSGHWISDFIPTIPGTENHIETTDGNRSVQIAFCDSNKQYLRGYSAENSITKITPEDASYVVFGSSYIGGSHTGYYEETYTPNIIPSSASGSLIFNMYSNNTTQPTSTSPYMWDLTGLKLNDFYTYGMNNNVKPSDDSYIKINTTQLYGATGRYNGNTFRQIDTSAWNALSISPILFAEDIVRIKVTTSSNTSMLHYYSTDYDRSTNTVTTHGFSGGGTSSGDWLGSTNFPIGADKYAIRLITLSNYAQVEWFDITTEDVNGVENTTRFYMNDISIVTADELAEKPIIEEFIYYNRLSEVKSITMPQRMPGYSVRLVNADITPDEYPTMLYPKLIDTMLPITGKLDYTKYNGTSLAWAYAYTTDDVNINPLDSRSQGQITNDYNKLYSTDFVDIVDVWIYKDTDLSKFSVNSNIKKMYIELTSNNYGGRTQEAYGYFPNATEIYYFDDGSITTLRNTYSGTGNPGQDTMEKIVYMEGYFKNITSLERLTWYQRGLKSIDIRGLNNGKVTNMGAMLMGLDNLEEVIGLDDFDVSNVTTANQLFYGCPKFNKLVDLSNFTKVTNLSNAFEGCRALTQSPILPNSVTNMANTFRGCTSLTQAPTIPQGVTNMENTFHSCTSLTQAPAIPNSVTNMSATFYGCTSLTQAPAIGSGVTSMNNCFCGCTSLTTPAITPESVTTMSQCYSDCTALTTPPNIPNGCLNISYLCNRCSALKGDVVIPNSITGAEWAFRRTKIDSITLPLNSITSYGSMLDGCSNVDIIWAGERGNDFNVVNMLGSCVPTQEDIQELVPEHLADATTNIYTIKNRIANINGLEFDLNSHQAYYVGNLIMGTNGSWGEYPSGGCGLIQKAILNGVEIIPILDTSGNPCFLNTSNGSLYYDSMEGTMTAGNIIGTYDGYSKLSYIKTENCYVEAEDIEIDIDTHDLEYHLLVDGTLSEVNRHCVNFLGSARSAIRFYHPSGWFYNTSSNFRTGTATLTLDETYGAYLSPDEVFSANAKGWTIVGASSDFTIVNASVDASTLTTDESVLSCFIELTSANYKTRIDEILQWYPNCTDLYFFDDGSVTTLNHMITTIEETNNQTYKGQIQKVIFVDGYFENLTNIKRAFNTMSNLVEVDLNGIKGKITDTQYTFVQCQNLETIRMDKLDLSKLYNATHMFFECYKFNGVVDFSNSPLTAYALANTFRGCRALTITPKLPSNISNGQISGTFYDCRALTQAPTIPNGVTNMNSAFYDCSSLTQAPTIPQGVTSMEQTFRGCSSLTQAPAIPNSVTNMNQTFYYCTSLTQAPIIPNSVTNISMMLALCEKVTSITLPLANIQTYNGALNSTGITDITWVGERNSDLDITSLYFNGCSQEDIQELVPEHLKDLHKDEIKISFSNKKITINNTETTWEEE